MKKWRDIRAAKGWIVGLASIIGLSYGGYIFVHRAITTQVYVTNCGALDYKPTTLIKFCSDDGVEIVQIEWSLWSAQGATGNGTYEINDCAPNCASGKRHYADIVITLGKAKVLDGKSALTSISIKTKDGKNLPLSDSSFDAWPLELAG